MNTQNLQHVEMKKRGRPSLATVKASTPINLVIEPVRLNDIEFDENIFIPVQTGHPLIDKFISADGGFMPATNLIAVGDPGVGKSTVLLDFLCRAKKNAGKRVLFISGEMNRIDMVGYCKRYPQFAFVDTVFMGDYAEYDPKMVIEKALEPGYDLVLIDSWAEVIDSVKDEHKWNAGKAEHWLLHLLETHNKGANHNQSYTCFLIIQQVTKGGDFVGSNRLKHMTTGMMHMRFDKDSGYRYMEFSKNRRGIVGEKVGFVLSNKLISYTEFAHMVVANRD